MHSDVLNCDTRAAFPTPGAPNMPTENESDGPVFVGRICSGCLIGLDTGGLALPLRDRLRLKESPRFITPEK